MVQCGLVNGGMMIQTQHKFYRRIASPADLCRRFWTIQKFG